MRLAMEETRKKPKFYAQGWFTILSFFYAKKLWGTRRDGLGIATMNVGF
jgi:hypothetical protein